MKTPEQKAAKAAYQKEWNLKNPERAKELSLRGKERFKLRHPERFKELSRKSYLKNRDAKVIDGAKFRALRDKVPFDLIREDIVFPEFCPVLGIKLEHGKGKQSDNSPTLDRFIPSLGYVKGNVNIISAKANRMKADATSEEVRKLLGWMRSIENKGKVYSAR